jgi:hypothetical protein
MMNDLLIMLNDAHPLVNVLGTIALIMVPALLCAQYGWLLYDMFGNHDRFYTPITKRNLKFYIIPLGIIVTIYKASWKYCKSDIKNMKENYRKWRERMANDE